MVNHKRTVDIQKSTLIHWYYHSIHHSKLEIWFTHTQTLTSWKTMSIDPYRFVGSTVAISGQCSQIFKAIIAKFAHTTKRKCIIFSINHESQKAAFASQTCSEISRRGNEMSIGMANIWTIYINQEWNTVYSNKIWLRSVSDYL